MKPFYIVVVLEPTKKQKEEEELTPSIIVQPTVVLAKDVESAKMKVVRLIPEEHVEKTERWRVYVCPFV